MMGKTFVSGGAVMTAPSAGTPLSELAVGSIIKLNENGSPVEFYVAKHDYESGLNGAGRTLLVRKECYGEYQWNEASGPFDYADSAISSYINSTYKSLLDTAVQEAVGTTKFYYTQYSDTSGVVELDRPIFLLSYTEMGGSNTYANVEGSALAIASVLLPVTIDGVNTTFWLRTPNTKYPGSIYFIGKNLGGNASGAVERGCRPCFTLPATALVRDDGTIKI